MPIAPAPAPAATLPAHDATPLAHDATPPVEGEAAQSDSEFGMLDQVETTKIRTAVTAVVSFLASKRLLPAMLMRVGPLRVLLPIVWGVYSLRSRKWLAGTSFICMGLLSFVLAFDPSLVTDIYATDDDSDVAAGDDEESQDVDPSSDFGSSEPAEFSIPARPNSKPAKSTPAVRAPIVQEASTASLRVPRSTGEQGRALGTTGGVWLVGTIEETDDDGIRRSAQREAVSRFRQ